MTGDSREPSRTAPVPPARTCPWCRGVLVFVPRYPVRLMIAGEPSGAPDHNVPEPLRTVPARVCATPHCRYREPA